MNKGFLKNKDFLINKGTVVTIGKFDGLHLGHMRIIEKTIDEAKKNDFQSVLFTFTPHPSSFFSNTPFYTILTDKEKIDLLNKIKLDHYIFHKFDKEFSSMPPQKFVKNVLYEQLNCKMLIIGESFKFGNNQSGNAQIAKEICKSLNMEVIIVPNETELEEKISSKKIRRLILESDFMNVKKLLNYPYFIMGEVIHGRKIGRTLGFPTINITAGENKLLPQNGVFYTKTHYNNKLIKGVTNIGTNPTVGGVKKTIETYLIDFDEIIYGHTLKIEFYKRLRNEQNFKSVEELKKQIFQDVNCAKSLN